MLVDKKHISLNELLEKIAEEDAFNYDGKVEQYYIVRFRQKDLWEEYPFDNDTLQTEFARTLARARVNREGSRRIKKDR